MPAIIQQRPYPAAFRADDKDIALLQGAALNQQRGHRPAATFDLRLDNDAGCCAIRIGAQFQQFGLQHDRFFQLVQPLASHR